jgi:uncharacterized protein DUF1858
MRQAIDPETKIGALLDAYPALEEVLIGMAPAFANLRNPVLRKTVAKVATLEQAAKLGGVSLPEMVRKLRAAAGIEGGGVEEGGADAGAAWLSGCAVAVEIDAAAMLERGVHPIGRVRECAAELRAGEAIRLTSPFRPEPLLDTMRRAGLEVYCEERDAGRFVSYFGLKR